MAVHWGVEVTELWCETRQEAPPTTADLVQHVLSQEAFWAQVCGGCPREQAPNAPMHSTV